MALVQTTPQLSLGFRGLGFRVESSLGHDGPVSMRILRGPAAVAAGSRLTHLREYGQLPGQHSIRSWQHKVLKPAHAKVEIVSQSEVTEADVSEEAPYQAWRHSNDPRWRVYVHGAYGMYCLGRSAAPRPLRIGMEWIVSS